MSILFPRLEINNRPQALDFAAPYDGSLALQTSTKHEDGYFGYLLHISIRVIVFLSRPTAIHLCSFLQDVDESRLGNLKDQSFFITNKQFWPTQT